MRILYKVTSRSRPEKLKETLANIQEFATNPNYLICLTLDRDDKTVNNPEFEEYLETNFGFELHTFWGNSKNKVDAINRDLEHFTSWDILINVSDDQRFTVKGFDNQIILAFNLFAPDTDGFIHFRDSNHEKPDALCTMSIIGRKYFERDKHIYNPAFTSLWCDNFAQDLAKLRGKYHFINECIFEHLHPAYGKGENDAQYKKTESFFHRDKLVYQRLKKQINKYL